MKLLFTIIYAIIGILLIVFSLMKSKQDQGASQAITGEMKDSFYEKNKSRTDEAKLDLLVKILFAVFCLLTLGSYFMFV